MKHLRTLRDLRAAVRVPGRSEGAREASTDDLADRLARQTVTVALASPKLTVGVAGLLDR
jgi:hypothetical protein